VLFASVGLLYFYKDTVLQTMGESFKKFATVVVDKAIEQKIDNLKKIISPFELAKSIIPLLEKQSQQAFVKAAQLLTPSTSAALEYSGITSLD
jgi:hypothetical protein